MRISEVANLTGLNVSNVRFYERKGLLTPIREEESKYRDYNEEDVKRIKQILLYRKMGVSVDSIYLLLNGQAERKEVLLRQKDELQSQIENLQGAFALCSLVLQEEQIDDEKLEQYLNYVHEEEAKGKQFAQVEELLEEITDFTWTVLFQWDPMNMWLFQRPKIARLLSVAFWIFLIAVPVINLISVFMWKTDLQIGLLAVYALIIVIYGTGFVRYRKAKKKYSKESVGE